MRLQEALRAKVNKWILTHSEVLNFELWGDTPKSWRKTVLVGLLMEWLGECLMPTQTHSDCSADPNSPWVLTRALERFIDRLPGPFLMGLPAGLDAMKARGRQLALILDQLARTYPELPALVQEIWTSRGAQSAASSNDAAFLIYLKTHPHLFETGEQDEEIIRQLIGESE
ncbi:MAG: hypothetical protein OEW39_09145 [Deltaproteobacteria bacterium]|nr:hypothetical protein [Deltaproteobacteria bacterium]